eukprot:COSAG03_NODE_17556_length_372_cov_241.813187_1_plen_104_part_10
MRRTWSNQAVEALGQQRTPQRGCHSNQEPFLVPAHTHTHARAHTQRTGMRERLAGNCDRPLFSGHLAVRTRVRPKLVYDELNGVVTVCVCARARARAVAHLAIN